MITILSVIAAASLLSIWLLIEALRAPEERATYEVDTQGSHLYVCQYGDELFIWDAHNQTEFIHL